MEKKATTFKCHPELKKALEREARKKQWTLSYYLETIAIDFARRFKIEYKDK